MEVILLIFCTILGAIGMELLGIVLERGLKWIGWR
jgi:hypothetical protein